jgi:hypothetical protein
MGKALGRRTSPGVSIEEHGAGKSALANHLNLKGVSRPP